MRRITDDLIKKYKKHLINEEKSKSTLEKYIRDISAFTLWLNGKELKKETILEYKAYLTENYAPASVNSMLSSVNGFFEHSEWHGLKVRALKIQGKIFADKDRELSKVEYERLLASAKRKNNKQLNLLMQTICSTGIDLCDSDLEGEACVLAFIGGECHSDVEF